jgi:PAS domain S-box-containing protein
MLLEKKLRRAAGLAGLLVGLLGLLVVIAWAFDLTRPGGIQHELLAIKTNVALGLLLCGASLWLQRHGWRSRRIGRVCAAMALVLTTTAAVGSLFGLPAGGAGFLFNGRPGQIESLVVGRIATHTAIALIAASLALLFLHQNRGRPRRSVSTWLAAVVIAIAGTTLIEHAFNDETTPEFAAGALMSLPTSLGLLALGVGIFFARPDDLIVRMLCAPSAAGVLARRLLFSVLVVPAGLCAALVASIDVIGVGDGVVALTIALILSGFASTLLAAEAAVGIDERREKAEQERLALTARLQGQAGELQETVARRTQELREVNERLRTLNQRLELATRSAELGVWEWDAATQTSQWDDRTLAIYGLKADEFHGRNEEWKKRLHPEDREKAMAAFRAVLAGANEFHQEFRIIRANDGATRYLESRAIVQRDATGRLVRVTGTERDITEQREGTQQMELLNERLKLALRSSNYGVWQFDIATNGLVWDDRMFEIYGMRREEFNGSRDVWGNCLHPEDAAATKDLARRVMNGEESVYNTEFRIVRPDGGVRYIEAHGYLHRDVHGNPVRFVGLNRDITPEKQVLEALEIAEERWQLALEGSNDGVWDWDIESGFIFHDERWANMLGYQPGEVTMNLDSWRRLVHPEDLPACEAAIRDHLAQRVPFYRHEYRIRAKSGEWKWVFERGKVVSRAPDGRPLRMAGTRTDITERKRLESRLRQVEELASQVSRLAQIGGWELDLVTSRLTLSEGVSRIYELDDDYQPTLSAFVDFHPPEARETLQAALREAVVHAAPFDLELALTSAKGRRAWVRVLGRGEFRDGRPLRIHGAIQDITSQHDSEEARRQLEIQLFQAQKMETLGTLAGGIAHDFNNLLTGIIGYHELAADSVPEDHPARACLTEARNASLRARELVEQILTFGRRSSGSDHGPIDLTVVIEEARRFLRATIPVTVHIETDISPDCGRVLADATQIHQVLLNLGSNGAHAMRLHGGTLRIVLEPVTLSSEQGTALGGLAAGLYVHLAVSDSGHGMDEATQRRIFDPFFTTKNTREGTGLGLAVVHGIIRAHRGTIKVKSQVGVGSTFNIYLPTAAQDEDLGPIDSAIVPRGMGQSVCVVDDDETVGSFTKLSLENKGYHARAFASGEEFLNHFLKNPGTCSVLVTDQTMPGMTGTDLIAAVRAVSPELPVVIMSGYFSKIPPETLDQLGRVELLRKPFTTDELMRVVHETLYPAADAEESVSPS